MFAPAEVEKPGILPDRRVPGFCRVRAEQEQGDAETPDHAPRRGAGGAGPGRAADMIEAPRRRAPPTAMRRRPPLPGAGRRLGWSCGDANLRWRDAPWDVDAAKGMPTAPLRPCPAPRCKALVSSGRCAAHGGPAATHRWDTDRPPVTRVRGRRLQALRARLFAAEPFCRACVAGRMTVATIRDHVIPLAEGGQDNEENVQPLCQACSDAKTREESKRGGYLNRWRLDAPETARKATSCLVVFKRRVSDVSRKG